MKIIVEKTLLLNYLRWKMLNNKQNHQLIKEVKKHK